jgi:hypothetical protein
MLRHRSYGYAAMATLLVACAGENSDAQNAMTRAEEMSGVWVTAFEESSFFPRDTAIPQPKDQRRYTSELHLDEDSVHRMASAVPSSGSGDAYLVSFIGRRSRAPWLVDCQGTPHFTFVVDRLLGARRLGSLNPVSRQELRDDLKSRPVTVTRKHGGRWGEEEDEAIKRCI